MNNGTFLNSKWQQIANIVNYVNYYFVSVGENLVDVISNSLDCVVMALLLPLLTTHSSSIVLLDTDSEEMDSVLVNLYLGSRYTGLEWDWYFFSETC